MVEDEVFSTERNNPWLGAAARHLGYPVRLKTTAGDDLLGDQRVLVGGATGHVTGERRLNCRVCTLSFRLICMSPDFSPNKI